MFEEHENCLLQNENNVVLNEKSVEGKPCINRESNSLELTIYLYSCYDEYEAPSSCNTTVYLSESVRNSGNVIPPINIGSFIHLGRGMPDSSNRVASWHGAAKSESENPGDNRISQNADCENNF